MSYTVEYQVDLTYEISDEEAAEMFEQEADAYAWQEELDAAEMVARLKLIDMLVESEATETDFEPMGTREIEE